MCSIIELLIFFGIGVGVLVAFMICVDRGMKKYSLDEDVPE